MADGFKEMANHAAGQTSRDVESSVNRGIETVGTDADFLRKIESQGCQSQQYNMKDKNDCGNDDN